MDAVSASQLTEDRIDGEGCLADNIVYFARALRKAGLKIGPGAVADAIDAVDMIGIGSRDEFYAALFCIFVKRHEDQPVFDEAFRLFWRSRDLINKMISMMLHATPPTGEKQKQAAGSQRVSDALVSDKKRERPPREDPDIEFDSRFTTSENEIFRKTDFAQMTAKEIARARADMSKLVLPMDEVQTRRFQPTGRQVRIDPRRTMQQSLRSGGDLMLPRFREQRTIHPPLVILADISGSMSQYTRIFLHFMHVLTEKRRRVHTFLFGTRLSNMTRQMRMKDPDDAIDQCTRLVTDWSGGTRIGETIHEFNRLWSRRVLSQGAVVLLITDGLERDDTTLLEKELDRLHRSCRRLIWLNPLLRFDGFEARARGVLAMVPHVDELRSVHNLDSIADLAAALSLTRSRDADPKRYLTQNKTRFS
jgi:uncharacterized protein with von Willebrand factor type A (vWA) domain